MNLKERCISSESVYQGCLIRAYRDMVSLPDGGESVREYMRHDGAVCILPLTDEGEVLLEKQYRYAVEQVMTEIPAGKLDGPDEDPLEAAKRELREETGVEADEWFDLGPFLPAPAYSTEKIYMYAAKGLHFGRQDMDEDEFLEVFRMPLEELVEEVLAGNIPDIKTQTAALRVYMMHQRGML